MKNLEITSINEQDLAINNNPLFSEPVSYRELEYFRKSVFTTCALAMEQIIGYSDPEQLKKSIDEIRFVMEFVGKMTIGAECDILDELQGYFTDKKKTDFTFFLNDNEAIDPENRKQTISVHS